VVQRTKTTIHSRSQEYRGILAEIAYGMP